MWEHILCRKHAFNDNSYHESQNVPWIEKFFVIHVCKEEQEFVGVKSVLLGDHHDEQS